MICPYNDFKDTDCKNCGARMWVKGPFHIGHLMCVCAIAYNGGAVQKTCQKENKEEK